MRHNIAFLLDFAAGVWGTRDDMLLALCQELASRHVTPLLVTTERPPESTRLRYEAAGARLEAINYGDGLLHYASRVRSLISQYSIDTAHIRYFDPWTALPWLTRLLGIRNIILTDAQGGVPTAVPWKKRLLALRAAILNHPTSRMIAISDFVRQRLVGFGISPEKITVIHNGVDARHYRPDSEMRARWAKRFSLTPRDVILATASSLLPIKDVNTILESAALLLRDGVPVQLFVAGEGPLQDRLQELSQQLGIAERTHWLGYADPRPLMQACDVFLLASVGEGFGNVLTEAMACAAPVVAAGSGGVPEVVADGETGLLVAPRNPGAFAEAVQMLVRTPQLRQEMGRRGRQRTQQHFPLERFAAKTIRLYERLWDDTAAPPVATAARPPVA